MAISRGRFLLGFLIGCISALVRHTPVSAQVFTEFTLPTANSKPSDIASAPNGDLWIALGGTNRVARITIQGTITQFTIPPTFEVADYRSASLAVATDGNVWLTNGSIIKRVTPTGVVTQYSTPPSGNVGPAEDMVATPDGNVWFTTGNYLSPSRAYFRVSSTGVVTRFSAASTDLAGLTVTTDGTIWYAGPNYSEINNQTQEHFPSAIARLAADGTPMPFVIPTNNVLDTQLNKPLRLAADSSGNMWFTMPDAGKVGRMRQDGVFTLFSLPNANSKPHDIVLGPDGNMWVTLPGVNKIARINNANGTVTEFAVPAANAALKSITLGKDGNLWIVGSGVNKVFRFSPPLSGQRIGNVYSSTQDNTRSFIRIANSSTTFDGSVTITLANPETGQSLAEWTSGNIRANAAVQFAMADIESQANPATFTKLPTYSMTIEPRLRGFVQHVLWRPSNGTLTNASTCSSGVTANERAIYNVHSSRIPTGYPSTVVVANSGRAAAIALLGIYNSADGSRLGTYTSPSIPPAAQFSILATDIEKSIGLAPNAQTVHYNIKIENSFPGFLQHIVNNQAAGVLTDMTSVCAFDTSDIASEKKFQTYTFQSSVSAIATSSDGRLWYRAGDNRIGSIGLDDSRAEFSNPSAPNSSLPENLTVAPNGDLWMSDCDSFYRVTPSRVFTAFTPEFSEEENFFVCYGPPKSIVADGQGNVWDVPNGWIRRMSPSNPVGFARELPTEHPGIALAADRSLWFRTGDRAEISRFGLDNKVTNFNVPTLSPSNYYNGERELDDVPSLTLGPDGNFWFNALSARRIGRITSAGQSVEFQLTTNSRPKTIVSGADGNIWFIADESKVSRFTLNGQASEFHGTARTLAISQFVSGADGNLWYLDNTSDESAIITRMTTTIRLPGIYASTQTNTQSFLRFINTGSSEGTVRVTLHNPTTGAVLAQWTSPAIAARAARQFPIAQVESGAVPSTFQRPAQYVITIAPQMQGYVQHVLWRPSDGTLTNATTCSAGASAATDMLPNVHSSLLDNGYPSTVIVYNMARTAGSATLGIYDATTGQRLSTYVTPSIASNGHIRLPVASIEAATAISPGTSRFHYTIRTELPFSGFLQHAVANQQAGVITDMTTVCVL